MRLMAGSFHELAKEPNNFVLFEEALKFMGNRITDPAVRPFGEFKHAIANYYKERPLAQKKRFWIFLAIIAYLIVGLIIAARRGSKRLLFTWIKTLFKK